MNPANHLAKLRAANRKRTAEFNSLIGGLKPPLEMQDDIRIAYVIIEMANLWYSFSRAFYLSVMMGTKAMSGTKVVAPNRTLRSYTEALKFAITQKKPRVLKQKPNGPWNWQDEPDWRNTQILVDLTIAAENPAAPTVQKAMSYQTDLFTYLADFRNFFAHRKKDTAEGVRNVARALALPVQKRPCELLLTPRQRGADSILHGWLDDLRDVVDILCT